MRSTRKRPFGHGTFRGVGGSRPTAFLTILGTALATLIPAAGCRAPSAARLVTAEQLQQAAYYKYWETNLPLVKGDSVQNCYLVDDNLYVTTRDGHLYCLSGEEGLLRWNDVVAKPDYVIFRPSHIRAPDGAGPVAVVTTTETSIRDRYSGEVITAFVPPFPPGAGAVGEGNRLYMGGSNGRVYALQWNHPFGREPLRRWELLAGAPVTADPVLYGPDQLIFASQSGTVVSCGAFNKSYDWAVKTEAAVVADPFVDETGVYVASTDRSLYRFDLSSGDPRWRFCFPRPLTDAPVVARFTCYQFCPGLGLTAVDVDTGQEKWRREDGLAFVSAGFGETAVLTAGGTVDIVDANTGETKRSFSAGEAHLAVCNPVDDRVILATADGHLTCARPDSTPYLKLQQVTAASRDLTKSPKADRDSRLREPVTPPPPPAADEDPFRSGFDR